MTNENLVETKYFFVDEAGNPEIFARRRKVIVGTPGCSRFFILGFLDVDDPNGLRTDLEMLRKDLLSDPYFRNVPSMQQEYKKTAISFHTKDDVPEVRREAFKLLKTKPSLRFVGVVKDKFRVVQYALSRRAADNSYNYNPNELYDFLTRRIFKDHLHLAKQYKVCFATRGNKPRTDALGKALQTAQERFIIERNIENPSALDVIPTFSKNDPCLQAADYFLWALQRIYERREERYLDYMKDFYKLVIDLDDTRHNKYGEYYHKTNPLNLETIKQST